MKTKPICLFVITLALFGGVRQSLAQGTAFTYQGHLNVNGSPANGSYDFTFSLSENSTGTIIQAVTGTPGVPVTNGLFTTTIDFGSGVFTGLSNWLQIAVRSNNTGSYSNLAPLQFLTPTPNAIFANVASNLLGTLPVARLSGQLGNNQLANSALTVNAGTGLSGGGLVILGGSTTLTNTGVLSVTGTNDLTATNTAGAVKIFDNGTNSAVANTLVKRDNTGSSTFSNLTVVNELVLGAGTGTSYPLVEDSGGDIFIATDSKGNLFTGIDAGFAEIFNDANYTGTANTGFGSAAMFFNRNGSYNTVLGESSLYYSFYGSNNTAIGYSALGELGQTLGETIAGGSNNIAVGYEAGFYYNSNESGNIVIGHIGIGGENNTIRIGTPGVQTNTYIAGVINGNGGGLTNTTTAGNYVFAYDTTTQVITTANSPQTISFSTTGQLNGWSHTPGSAPFTCTQAGLYLVQYTAEAESTASGTITVSLRATVDSTTAEVSGSQSSITLGAASEPAPVSKSFIVSLNSGDVMYFEVYGSSTSAALVTGNGSGTTKPSVSCTIIRIQ